jgi:hypothetical protein
LKKNFDVFLPIDKVEKSGEGDEATYTISGMAFHIRQRPTAGADRSRKE